MNVDIEELNQDLRRFRKLHAKEIAENTRRYRLQAMRANIIRGTKKPQGNEKGR